MRILLLFAVILLLAGCVNALENDVKVDLLPSGAAHEIVEITFIAGADADEISYSLLNQPENLKVYQITNTVSSIESVRLDELSYKISKNEYYEVVINKQVKKGQNYKIKMEFDIKGLIRQLNRNYIFSFKYQPSTSFENFNIDVSLPKGFILTELESAVSPSGGKVGTDGKSIIVSWNLKGISNEQAFIIVYERGLVNSNSYVWIIITIVVALGAIAGVITFYRKEKKDVVSGVLSHDEKKIVSMIEAVNEITQKQIVKDTGFSKAKVSKIIRRLEEKGIVEKTPYMATNKLKIKNKIRR